LQNSVIISSFWPPNYIEEKVVTVTREKTFQQVSEVGDEISTLAAASVEQMCW